MAAEMRLWRSAWVCIAVLAFDWHCQKRRWRCKRWLPSCHRWRRWKHCLRCSTSFLSRPRGGFSSSESPRAPPVRLVLVPAPVQPVGLPQQLTTLGRTLVMAVLNVTPDSFSDGGRFLDVDAAVERGRQQSQLGADLIDVGG